MTDVSLNTGYAFGGTLAVTDGGTGQTSYTDGQLLIGKTDGTLAKFTLTAGGGITVTNGDGAVTIAAEVVDLATADVTGRTLTATKGGTGQSSYSLGDMLYASAPNSLSRLATGASNTVLLGGGLTPAWGKVTMPNHVDGLLTVGLGGTNSSTALTGSSIMISNGTSIVQGTAGTSTQVLHGNASGAPTYSAVALAADVSGTLLVANGGTGQTSYTNGQLLIGNTTGNTLTKSTLTAGSGVSITNGGGSITIATTGPTPNVEVLGREPVYGENESSV